MMGMYRTMDALALTALASPAFRAQLKERFEDKKQSASDKASASAGVIILVVLYVAMAAYAAYLSWSCNTLTGMSVPAKVFFGFFAALGGLSYLVSYLLFRWSDCTFIAERLTPPAPAAPPAYAPVTGGRRRGRGRR